MRESGGNIAADGRLVKIFGPCRRDRKEDKSWMEPGELNSWLNMKPPVSISRDKHCSLVNQ